MIRLDELILHNFRCFPECSVSFHPELTVLVSRNGQGKTAILDAIAIAMGFFTDTLAGTKRSGFKKRDVHLVRSESGGMVPSRSVELDAVATLRGGEPLQWLLSMVGDKPRARTSAKDAKELLSRAEEMRFEANETTTALPLIAYYGTGRRWDDAKRTRKWGQSNESRFAGYSACLGSTAVYDSFVAWYESFFYWAKEKPTYGGRSEMPPERLLAAVNQAVRDVLEEETGWAGLHWDAERRLCVEHPELGVLPLGFLSDGIRNTAVLVADIAYRCAVLNPQFGKDAARETPGLLMIDEVDLHLHPEWQQTIVGALQRTFPRLQLVLSTHSPQVLSAVDVESIRVIRANDEGTSVTTPEFQTRGVESADVLATIMGVDPIARVPEAQLLSDYRALIEDRRYDSDQASVLKSRLMEHFGAQHPVILDCERLLRFMQFKRERQSGGPADA